jgi:hypothetical protein
MGESPGINRRGTPQHSNPPLPRHQPGHVSRQKAKGGQVRGVVSFATWAGPGRGLESPGEGRADGPGSRAKMAVN